MSIQPVVRELNFDCLVGPTHFFGGLSVGNLASTNNQRRLSSPKRAALQGLNKMKYLADQGFLQAVLPPHDRPHIQTLRKLGFSGSPEYIISQAFELIPELFIKLCSSSSMWAANAATICPSKDALDNKIHITPANLVTMFHRSLEAEFNFKIFKIIFSNPDYFTVHSPLPAHDLFSDEGAANHNRLCETHDGLGLHIFVHGKESSILKQPSKIYPARQSLLANQALVRNHALDPKQIIHCAQNPLAIDAGAFHNDVVCVTNEHLMLVHELAFYEQEQIIINIINKYEILNKKSPIIIVISQQELPIQHAVSSYLFNSQILTKADKSMILFAPAESEHDIYAQQIIANLINSNNPINQVKFFDISESMANGGGPACLRLRVPINQQELNMLNPKIFLTQELYNNLNNIINKYYPEDLKIEYLFDPVFIKQTQEALDNISQALGLSPLYNWQ